MVVYLCKLKSDFRTVAVTMYQTKKYKQAKKRGKQKWPPVTLLPLPRLGDWPLKSFQPHRSAHTGTHNGGGLYSSLLGGCLVFIEAEPHFGVKIILCLNSQPHNKQDEPNTPAYRNPARFL